MNRFIDLASTLGHQMAPAGIGEEECEDLKATAIYLNIASNGDE
jgi:hypothetical protein